MNHRPEFCPGCAARDSLLSIIERAWRNKWPSWKLLELFGRWPGKDADGRHAD